jgi:hypothetical protein
MTTTATPRPLTHSSPTVGRTTIDAVRRSCGGYEVFISHGIDYGEAVIIDRGYPGLAAPAVLVNGPTYLMLRHPTLELWDAVHMWIMRDVDKKVAKANEHIDRLVEIGNAMQATRMLTFELEQIQATVQKSIDAMVQFGEALR